MCGRTVLSRGAEDLRREWRASRYIGRRDFHPDYNIGPTRFTPVVRKCRCRGPAPQDPSIRQHPSDACSPPQSLISSKSDHKEEERECEKVFNQEEEVIIQNMSWGLVASFLSDEEAHGTSKYNTINARCEGITSSPTYRRLLQKNRCVVPIEGFYEWNRFTTKMGEKKKVPYYIYNKDPKKMLYVAGLWDRWRAKSIYVPKEYKYRGKKRYEDAEKGREDQDEEEEDEEETENVRKDKQGNEEEEEEEEGEGGEDEEMELKEVYTYTIITGDAGSDIGWLHDRMPIFLTEEQCEMWMDPNIPFEQVASFLKPAKDLLAWHEVSAEVGKVTVKGSHLIQKAEERKKQTFAAGLGRFFTKVEPGSGPPVPSPKRKKGSERERKTETSSTTTPSGDVIEIDMEKGEEKGEEEREKVKKVKLASYFSPTSSPSRSPAKSQRVKASPKKKKDTVVKKGPLDMFFKPKK